MQPHRQDANGQMPASTCACLHIHTAPRQPDREVYIISLGSQPEPTQSFESMNHRGRGEETDRRKERQSMKLKQERRSEQVATSDSTTTQLIVHAAFFLLLEPDEPSLP